jgi:hypothetical protein
MEFFDKVKGQAKELKVMVEDKVEGVQGKRTAADLLHDLGRFLYAERAAQETPPWAAIHIEVVRPQFARDFLSHCHTVVIGTTERLPLYAGR